MKRWVLIAIPVVFVLAYAALVALIGFDGVIGMSINFGRVAAATAVLILVAPSFWTIFTHKPPPPRDYFLAGVFLALSSAVLFAIWNEAGRIFGVVTSIFVSPIAGFFSLLLVVACVFLFFTPDTGSRKQKIIALIAGVVAAAAITLIAPLFR